MIKRFIRLVQIQLILGRYGLGHLLLQTHHIRWWSPLRLLIYLNLGHWLRRRDLTRGEAVHQAIEALGPIFVKFGQALSTRPDLIPKDMIQELILLQDKVPPFDSGRAIKIIEKAYKKSIADIFSDFESVPLASASIAQVHTAELKNGKKVVVKVLRPKIAKLIRRDVDLLYSLAHLIERYWQDSKRLRLIEVIAEFERVIFDELDFNREAANASQLRRNFSDSHVLYVPETYWQYARTNVIIQERISGIPVLDLETLREQGFDLKRLAERGVEIFFTQVFRDCFFHADMHPGNIFVSPHNPRDPRYIAVDFGIMGSLSQSDQHYLAENFLAFFQRDYRRVAELHVESGWVPRTTRVDEFESAIRTVCEPIFEQPLKEISFGQVLLRLFQTGRRFNMEVQPQLVLLQKTLLAVEGLGRQLYPELDLWNTAKPFLEKWLKERVGVRATWRRIQRDSIFWSQKLPELPMLMHDTLTYMKQQQLQEQAPKKKADRSWQWFSVSATLFAMGIVIGHWLIR